jgi:phosphoserine phosphatase
MNHAVTAPAVPFRAVYFDCDSTLTTIEGVDELLADYAPAVRAEIAAWTEAAMNGERPLAEVYELRLRKLAPRRDQLAAVGRLYATRAVPDAARTLAALRWLGKVVGIVSGGLLEPVRAFAQVLQLDLAHVHAVPLQFDADGAYLDFDHRCPLWRNGGKVELLRGLPAEHRPLAFVGDGITDLETQGTADRFVGFGGVVRRAAVAARAECFVDAPGLAAVLPFLLTTAERARLAAEPRFADLLPPPQKP